MRDMSDSMETGGFGKNPAIDKINKIDAVKSRMNAVRELEKKVFQPAQPKQKAVLGRRKQILEEFQISFKKGGKQEHGTILHGGERRLSAGEYPVHAPESGQIRTADRTAGRVLPNGGRPAAQVLSEKGTAGTNSGGQQRRADDSTVIKAQNKIRPDTFHSRGTVPDDKRVVSKIQDIASLPVRGREVSSRLVSDGNDRYGDRTYKSSEHSKGACGIADFHISSQRIHEVEKHHTAEFQDIKGEQ